MESVECCPIQTLPEIIIEFWKSMYSDLLSKLQGLQNPIENMEERFTLGSRFLVKEGLVA